MKNWWSTCKEISLCVLCSFMQRMLHWVNKSTSSNVIFERDIIFLYKYHYNKRCKPVLMMWPESARAISVTSLLLFPVFCICGPGHDITLFTSHEDCWQLPRQRSSKVGAPRIFSGGWWSTAPGPDPWPGHSGQLLAPTKSSRNANARFFVQTCRELSILSGLRGVTQKSFGSLLALFIKLSELKILRLVTIGWGHPDAFICGLTL